MVVLMCEVAGNRFAVDVRQVAEVVARVRLQAVPNGPDWLAGVCVYRGQVTPVMDLSFVVAGKASPARWSTRIIMLHVTEEISSPLCGLIVEKVAVAQIGTVSPASGASTAAGVSPWGPLRLDEEGMFQLLELPRFSRPSGGKPWVSLNRRSADGRPPGKLAG